MPTYLVLCTVAGSSMHFRLPRKQTYFNRRMDHGLNICTILRPLCSTPLHRFQRPKTISRWCGYISNFKAMDSTAEGKSSALAKDILLVSIPSPPPHPDWAADIESRYPGLQVRWSPPVDPAAGRYGVLDDLPPEVWDGVTLLMCFRPPPAGRLSNVRYVQLTSAGADRWLRHDKYKDESVVFCTASGTHA